MKTQPNRRDVDKFWSDTFNEAGENETALRVRRIAGGYVNALADERDSLARDRDYWEDEYGKVASAVVAAAGLDGSYGWDDALAAMKRRHDALRAELQQAEQRLASLTAEREQMKFTAPHSGSKRCDEEVG